MIKIQQSRFDAKWLNHRIKYLRKNKEYIVYVHSHDLKSEKQTNQTQLKLSTRLPVSIKHWMSQPLLATIPTIKSLLNKTTFIWSQSYFIKISLLFLETSLKLLINFQGFFDGLHLLSHSGNIILKNVKPLSNLFKSVIEDKHIS